MNSGVLVPAFLAAAVITARAVLGHQRAPYPYEYLSWLVVYGGIGILPEQPGQALAWAYLLAIVLAPGFADVMKLAAGAFKHPNAPLRPAKKPARKGAP